MGLFSPLPCPQTARPSGCKGARNAREPATNPCGATGASGSHPHFLRSSRRLGKSGANRKCDPEARVSEAILAGSHRLLCKRRRVRRSRCAGRLAPCDGMRQQGAMKTSITWSPGAGLNAVASNGASGRGRSRWTAGSRPSARDAAHSPNRATALTGERSGIYPRKERRSSLMPASGAGGVETSCVIGASSPSACRVLRRRSRAGPPAWRESSGCLAIALADGPGAADETARDAGQRHDDPGRPEEARQGSVRKQRRGRRPCGRRR